MKEIIMKTSKRPNYLEIDKAYDEVIKERDMLADENQKMAKFLKEIGYTANEIDNIATGWMTSINNKGEV